MKVLVAMSGGVDSSLTACLLKEQGHDVIGVRFTIWSDPLAPPAAQLRSRKCCDPQTIYRANTVAQILGIKLLHIDLQKEFEQKIVRPFLAEYRSGRTPNPCVLCNRVIKFDLLMHKAHELQCDAIATGHYARVVKSQSDAGETVYRLFEGTDPSKSQAYFLYTLSQEILAQTLFPLGTLKKTDVIARAHTIGIPLPPEYEESQDVCFYPEKEPKEFLQRHLSDAMTPGPIKTTDERTVGEHKGLPLYTIGQRKGLNIGGLKIPLHVVKKDVASNTLFVAPSGADRESALYVKSPNWIAEAPAEGTEISLQARICSQGQKYRGALRHERAQTTFYFTTPIRGIAPGQSAVFYNGDEVVGGGIIERAFTPSKRNA